VEVKTGSNELATEQRSDPVKPTATSLSWATSARTLPWARLDPLLDLGQELINQHRPGHPADSQAAISYGDVPGDGVMRDPGELAGNT
jgi:hypothetical protein